MDSHDHDKGTGLRRELKEKKALTVVLCLTVSFMFVEAAAGFFTGSLALLSDAAHMLIDIVAISLALFAIWFSLRPPTSRKTFGFYRAEILAARQVSQPCKTQTFFERSAVLEKTRLQK